MGCEPRGPHDSRDSGVSSGSSQDYGECTPPVEKSLVFPRFPTRVGSSDRPTVPFSQLVRKLSEVEGIMPNIALKTSLDEGVDIDNSSESALSDAGSFHTRRPKLSQLASFDSASLGSCSTGITDTTGLKDSPGGSFTSTESYPYESFDCCDNLTSGDTDLTQSLPSCSASTSAQDMLQESSSDTRFTHGRPQPHSVQNTPPSSLVSSQHHQQPASNLQQQPNVFLQLPPQHPGASFNPGDRQILVRSPVHFREGRRASDGFMSAQNVIAFQQKLYEKQKPSAGFELHDVQEEHRALQSQFGQQRQSQQQQYRSATPPDTQRNRKGPLVTMAGRPSVLSKRTSVPENFAYFPSVGGLPLSSGSSSSSQSQQQSAQQKQNIALQQQLMQHRLHQKRQAKSQSSSSSRALRKMTGIKYSQQPGNAKLMPYLPQDAFQYLPSGCQPGGDFLFQPIAEDEPGLDELEVIIGPSQVEAKGQDNSVSAPMKDDSQWQTLPNYMQESCKLGKDSPPPNAASTAEEDQETNSENMDTLSPV